jgi:uncharacterized membrane protein
MTYYQLAYAHLATVVPAFLIGTALLVTKKGTVWHKRLGRIYMPLMLVTALITLLMPAAVGPRLFHHFGFIHLFSVLVFYSVPAAYIYARQGNIAKHKKEMIGLYIGGMLIAGSLAFLPGRLLNHWITQAP